MLLDCDEVLGFVVVVVFFFPKYSVAGCGGINGHNEIQVLEKIRYIMFNWKKQKRPLHKRCPFSLQISI